MMYVGFLFIIVELLGGFLFFSVFDVVKCYLIVIEMSIKFLKFVKIVVMVEFCISEEEIECINCEVEEKGKFVYILE